MHFVHSSTERDSLSKENGIPVPSVFEEVINLSVGTKLTRLDMDGENGVIPVVAFRENGSLRPLAGTDDVQVQQAAGEPPQHRHAPLPDGIIDTQTLIMLLCSQ